MMGLYEINNIQIELAAGYDRYNAPLPSSLIQIQGFLEYKSEILKNKNGLDVLSKSVIRTKYNGDLSNADFAIIKGKKHKIAYIETQQSFTEKITLIKLESGQ